MPNNWFEQTARATWEEYLTPHEGILNTYLELGIGEGDSIIWAIENLNLKKVYAVDEWMAVSSRHDQQSYDVARQNALAKLKPYKDIVTIYEMSTREFWCGGAAWKILDESVDLAYIDASHTGWDSMLDAANVFYKLKSSHHKTGVKGGIMVWDDMNRIHHRQQSESRLAAYGYLISHTGRYIPLAWTNRQLLLWKV